MTAPLELGDYLVRVQCPHCDRFAEVPAVIEQVLKVKGSEGSLTVAVAAKPVPHDCNQLAIDDEEQPTLEDDVVGVVRDFVRDTAEALGSGASMTLSHVDRETGEIREVGVIGGGA